ncbi:MAG: hypothetical protein Kow0092_30850 [Deferrisomatales bacterium]
MPLAFSSLTHGTVAFGFYNVETDGLLLEDHFFFCTELCRAALALANGAARAFVPGHVFDRPEAVGDLMGAIHGVRWTGYLGEVYRLWPFPARPEAFRQRLEGHRTRAAVEALLDRWARRSRIRLLRSAGSVPFQIGPYGFSEAGWRELVAYVHRGGHPTWEGFEEGRRPPWVAEAAAAWGIGSAGGEPQPGP